MDPFAVHLDNFSGPLDLLLHLIRKNEMEITDIPIARIGEQYLEYLALMRELDLEMVGEYTVAACESCGRLLGFTGIPLARRAHPTNGKTERFWKWQGKTTSNRWIGSS